jgi:hypothetical protein
MYTRVMLIDRMSKEDETKVIREADGDILSLLQLIKAEKWEKIEHQLAESTIEANVRSPANLFRSKSVCYPLHYLCKKNRCPLSTIKAMIEAAPAALSSTDADTKSLPMHIACWYGQPLESIQVLLSAKPTCVKRPDKDGNLPLHTAASLASPEVVQLLLEADPSTAATLNKRNQTPLHCACLRRDISTSVIDTLLEAAPDSVQRQDWLCRCPIHDACMNQAGTAVLGRLLAAFPRVVLVFDRQLLTPYGICRERFGLPTNDPVVQLIRKYMRQHSPAVIRFRNVLQFMAEDTKSAFGTKRHASAGKPKNVPR